LFQFSIFSFRIHQYLYSIHFYN